LPSYSDVVQVGGILQSAAFIPFAAGHNSVVKWDIGLSAAQFTNLEALWRLTGKVKALAIPPRGKKNVVLHVDVHRVSKNRVK